MKNFVAFFFLLALLGCSPKSEYDISPGQVKQLSRGPNLGDLKNLPKGAVVHEFKKGERLPDGSVADGSHKFVTVQVPSPGDKQVSP